jgi:hypothetical protein
MVLVDGVNGLFYECHRIIKPDKTLVPPSEITVFEAFKQAIKPDWVRIYSKRRGNIALFHATLCDLFLFSLEE